jgi:hypothetical protein
MAANFARGFCLALDNIAKAVPVGGKQLKPVRFVNGEPVFRFRVEAIRCGNYLTADGEPFEVTPAALKHWTDTFKQFKDRKIPVPVPSGTHFQIDGEHNRGNIIALSNDGKSLWATVELIGKDAPRIAASNSVSIYAEPEWQDTHGNKYEWPIRHLLLTPDPRIPGLKGFMPIAANNTTIHVPVLRYKAMATTARNAPKNSGKSARRPLALDQLGSANEAGLGVPGVGDGAALPADDGSTYGDLAAEPEGKKGGVNDLKSHVKEHFLDKAHTVLDDEEMEHADKLEAIKELLEEMERILEAFTEEEENEPKSKEAESAEEPVEQEEEPKGAAMSNVASNGMPQLRKHLGCANAQLAQLTSRLRRNEIDGLFNVGKINKPQHDQLLAQFCNPKHVALSLSNEDFGNSFDQAIALLSQNEEGKYGEQTGPQLPERALALSNPYRENQKEVDRQEAEDADMAKPSSLRASKNGRK